MIHTENERFTCPMLRGVALALTLFFHSDCSFQGYIRQNFPTGVYDLEYLIRSADRLKAVRRYLTRGPYGFVAGGLRSARSIPRSSMNSFAFLL